MLGLWELIDFVEEFCDVFGGLAESAVDDGCEVHYVKFSLQERGNLFHGFGFSCARGAVEKEAMYADVAPDGIEHALNVVCDGFRQGE